MYIFDYAYEQYTYVASVIRITFFCCRQSALELERMTEQRRHEEEAWYRQQQLLVDAEQQRREMISLEEQKLLEQRKRLVDLFYN